MRTLYLVGAIIVFLMILVLALPQMGATCTFYFPLNSTNSCTFALIQAAGLGVIMGGVLILFWETPKPSSEDDDEEGEGSESGAK